MSVLASFLIQSYASTYVRLLDRIRAMNPVSHQLAPTFLFRFQSADASSLLLKKLLDQFCQECPDLIFNMPEFSFLYTQTGGYLSVISD